MDTAFPSPWSELPGQSFTGHTAPLSWSRGPAEGDGARPWVLPRRWACVRLVPSSVHPTVYTDMAGKKVAVSAPV